MSGIDLGGIDEEEQQSVLIKDVIDFCQGPDLIEVFGPSGSGKSVFSREIMRSLSNKTDKKALFIDTERNIGEVDELEGADYIYVPDWHDLYAYVVGNEGGLSEDPFGANTTGQRTLKQGYDMVVLDSIGFPALIQYGKYRVADDSDQFKVFNELQVITGELKKYAQHNDSLVVVTNQPKSDLSGSDDPDPFGDKSIFGFKEVWKTVKKSTNEIKTSCGIETFRSRQAGKGKEIFTVEVSDEGVEVIDRFDEEAEDEWSV